MSLPEEPDVSEAFLDKSIIARRDREFNEAWGDIASGDMPEDIKECLVNLCRDALSEHSSIATEWYNHYLTLHRLLDTHLLVSERNALWLMIRCLAVIAGTTGFKIGIAASQEVKEIK